MKNQWTKAVNEINRKRFTVPAGWSTREQVAEDLQCAPDKVAELLKPGLATKEFEKQDFSVWDENRRMTSRVTCYRMVQDAPEGKVVSDATDIPNDVKDRVIKRLRANPGYSDRRIAMNAKTSVKIVRALRAAIR